MPTSLQQRTVVKTASYTVNASVDRAGTLFLADGAGAIVFTLPTPGAGLHGHVYKFASLADQTLTIAAPATTVVGLDNAAAASVASSTADQKIGARFEAECIKNAAGAYKWLISLQASGVTPTVA